MKKITMILATIIISSMCFAQTTIKAYKPMVEAKYSAVSVEKSAWYGSSALHYLYTMEANDVVYVLASQVAAPTTSGSVTKVKFYVDNGADYPSSYGLGAYVGNSFDIQVYAVTDITTFDPTTATPDYTENYTATLEQENEVTLTTPYTIGSDYLIGIKANAQSLLICEQIQISDKVPADQTPTLTGTLDLSCYSLTTDGFGSVSGQMYTSQAQDSVAVFNTTFNLQFYVDDGGAYVPVYDAAAAFLELNAAETSILSIYTDGQEITLGATDLLPSIVPAATSVGIDLPVDSTDVYLTVGGQEVLINTLMLTNQYTIFGLDSLQTLSLAALEASQGAQITGEVCLESRLRAPGVDNDATNNIVCITITREQISIEENVVSTVSIYPNPSTGLVNVTSNENGDINIYDITGKLVNNNTINAGETVTFDLSAGMYFVNVNGNSTKVVVE